MSVRDKYQSRLLDNEFNDSKQFAFETITPVDTPVKYATQEQYRADQSKRISNDNSINQRHDFE